MLKVKFVASVRESMLFGGADVIRVWASFSMLGRVAGVAPCRLMIVMVFPLQFVCSTFFIFLSLFYYIANLKYKVY